MPGGRECDLSLLSLELFSLLHLQFESQPGKLLSATSVSSFVLLQSVGELRLQFLWR